MRILRAVARVLAGALAAAAVGAAGYGLAALVMQLIRGWAR